MFRWRHHSHDRVEDGRDHREEKVNQLKAAIGPLSRDELQYCDTPCLRRFLEARNWNLDRSKKMLEETLKWRSIYKPQEIRWHEVASEGETGKIYRASFHDKEGRSVLVLRPAKQNTTSQDDQIRHLVYLMENAILNLPEDQEQMVWLIDFTGWSLSNAVSVKATKATADVLQNHYPERLGAAYLYNPPKIFETFWKIVKHFLDPKTCQKVKFVYSKNEESVKLLTENFDFNSLPVQFGGSIEYQYEHEEYSKLMVKDELKMEAVWGMNSPAELAPEPFLPETPTN